MEIVSFALTPFLTNCFVLRDGGEAIIVDPGEAPSELLESVVGDRVRAVVNTHCHCDHCGGNAEVVRRTGAELLCHKDDLPLLRMVASQGMMFGVPFPASPDPSRFVKEGDILEVGSTRLTVYHTPGHSPGHIILVGDGFVIGGDVLFAGSIGRTDLPGGNFSQIMNSIRTKLLVLSDDTVVYCGHGPSTTIGAERQTNPFLAGS
ncbi:MAG: MBL fold metallo-hydrolase [Candidatus Hydrogenedentes bacterium]|nr:MBL fold metallo-hydrolase [Candidatus Hydrogenedentota bacterium]